MAQKQAAGRTLRVSGVALLVVGVLLGLSLRFVPEREWNEALLLISFLPPIMAVSGAFLFFRGRQYAARAAAEKVTADRKPDVLYLRPFRTDPSTPRHVFSALLTPSLISGLATEEEQLAEALQPFGDLVAIGQPGESLPKPGAARLYASEDEWREVVTRQMREARLVVLRAGTGEGVIWELKRAVDLLDPGRLLILFLRMKKKDYSTFREQAEPVLGAKLPEPGELRLWGRMTGFVRFDTDWRPEVLPLKAPRLRSSAYKPFRALFKFALKPVFEEHGVEWERPPISALMLIAMAILAAFVLLFLAVIASL